MIPLAVVMLDEFGDGAPKMGLPIGISRSRHSSLIDRTNRSAYALAFGARIGYDHPDSRIPQNTVDVWAPFRIAVTDQHVRRPKQSLVLRKNYRRPSVRVTASAPAVTLVWFTNTRWRRDQLFTPCTANGHPISGSERIGAACEP